MSNSVIFSPGTFFHGTRADLSVGDLLVPGYLSNYDENRAANYVSFYRDLGRCHLGDRAGFQEMESSGFCCGANRRI